MLETLSFINSFKNRELINFCKDIVAFRARSIELAADPFHLLSDQPFALPVFLAPDDVANVRVVGGEHRDLFTG